MKKFSCTDGDGSFGCVRGGGGTGQEDEAADPWVGTRRVQGVHPSKYSK